MEEPRNAKRLLRKYVAGECTPAETGTVLDYLQTSEGKQYMRDAMDEHLNSEPDAPLNEGVSRRMFARIQSEMRRVPERERKDGLPFGRASHEPQPAQHRHTIALRIGAAVTGMLVVLLVLYGAQRTLRNASTAPERLVATASPDGDHVVPLSDGTRVHLNGGASLVYPKRFTGETRAVRLVGEAYFEVADDAAVPFVVHTPQRRIRVVGTAFNLQTSSGKSDEEDPLVLAVTEGTVVLEEASEGRHEETARIEAGGVAVLSGGILHRSHSANVGNYASWAKGWLEFTDMALPDVAQQLEHLYDIEIVLDDPGLQNMHLTVRLRRRGAMEVLRQITTALGLSHEWQSGIVHVTTQA